MIYTITLNADELEMVLDGLHTLLSDYCINYEQEAPLITLINRIEKETKMNENNQ